MPYKVSKRDNCYAVIPTVDPMDSQIHNYSLYGGVLRTGMIKRLLQKSYDDKLEGHDGYEVDKQLSGKRFQAYYHPEENHLVCVHRGTADISDWMTDLRYAFGNKSKRFDYARQKQQEAEEKYKPFNAKISILGHSLGGPLAEHAKTNEDADLITLNRAVNIPDMIKRKPTPKTFDIKTSRDPVSWLLGGPNTTIIPSKSINPLKEHSTEALSRLDPDMEFGTGMRKVRGTRNTKI
eukprot:gene8704-11761_t